jgi:hypothetical protein
VKLLQFRFKFAVKDVPFYFSSETFAADRDVHFLKLKIMQQSKIYRLSFAQQGNYERNNFIEDQGQDICIKNNSKPC